MTGSAAINASGNALANALTGNSGNNVLDGSTGADALAGGGGNDTYVVDNAGDFVTEVAGAGMDVVLTSVTHALSMNVENLTMTGNSAIAASGNALVNLITGNTGNNVLDGGSAADVLTGGLGNDTYVIDNVSDLVVENTAEGTDLVQSGVSCALVANVENLTLTGIANLNGTGNTLDNVITGNSGNNMLDGGVGTDSLKGGTGNDTYIIDSATDIVTEFAGEGIDSVQSAINLTLMANVENIALSGVGNVNATGNALANALTGNAGNNVLNGGAGADIMAGGLGNDIYVLDSTTDVVTEALNAGTDTVQSVISSALAANVENLTLTGTAAINGTGNGLDNALQGNAANNMLDGGAGIDTLAGGAGNDTYVIDNVSDVVTEAAAAGVDSVQASATHTLYANIEYLTLTGIAAVNGTGNVLDNWLQGNGAGNLLAGADGNDALWAADGNDQLDGGNGIDLLQGGNGIDVLTDMAGNNLLDGGAGADTLTAGAGRDMLIGGAGNDTITTGGGADIIGFNKGSGADIVKASAGSDDTLSLGGGIAYADLKLRKTGLDLILDAANGDQITFKDWYQTGINNKSILNLQVVADAMTAFNPAGSDALLNKKVVNFNFSTAVGQFDAALLANPTMTSWSMSTGLSSAYVSGSDTAAIGGDLAYDFGHRSALDGIGTGPAQTVLSSAGFATAAQSLQPAATLYAGPVRLM